MKNTVQNLAADYLESDISVSRSSLYLNQAIESVQALGLDFEVELGKYSSIYDGLIESLVNSNSEDPDQAKEKELEYFKWLDFDYLKAEAKKVELLVKELHSQNYQNLFVVGMGGSGINSLVFKNLFYDYNPDKHNAKYHIEVQNNLDIQSLDSKLNSILASGSLDKTLFLFISKSGNTDEVSRNLLRIIDFFQENTKGNYLANLARQSMIITENKDSFLTQFRDELHDRTDINIRYLEHHPEIGGRYSICSPVGLLALSFLGFDINKMLIGALNCFENLTQGKGLKASNIGKYSILDILFSQDAFQNRYSMVYSDSLEAMNRFRAQLRGESLNKADISSLIHISGTGTVNHHSDLEMLFKGSNGVVFEQLFIAENQHDKDLGSRMPFSQAFEGQSMHNSLISGHILPIFRYLSENKKPVILNIIHRLDEESIGYFCMQDMLSTVIQAGLQGKLDDSIRQWEVERYKEAARAFKF